MVASLTRCIVFYFSRTVTPQIAEDIASRYEELRGKGLRSMHPSLDGPGKLIAGAGPDGIAIELQHPTFVRQRN